MTNREMLEKALKICTNNKEMFESLGIREFSTVGNEVRKCLYAEKLKEDYGILNITRDMVRHAEPDVYVKINEFMYITSMGTKYNRTISWSADGKQPTAEVMLVLSFPTGAYIFGNSYPKDLFIEFWSELRTYKFKFVDDVNSSIYFSLSEAALIANSFKSILDKYHKRFRDEADVRRIEELKNELEKLEVKQNEHNTP